MDEYATLVKELGMEDEWATLAKEIIGASLGTNPEKLLTSSGLPPETRVVRLVPTHSPDEVRREANGRSIVIFDQWTMLGKILERYEAVRARTYPPAFITSLILIFSIDDTEAVA
jgi:hypothetical protein